MTTFNPAAEHRCARCGQWWWKTHICPVQLGQVLPLPVLTPSAPVEVTTTDKLTAERDALRAEVERLRAAARAVCKLADVRNWVLGRPVPVPPHALDNLRDALYETASAAQEGRT